MLPKTSPQVKSFLEQLKERPEQFWMMRGKGATLDRFHRMAREVPAYKDFLNKHKIDHEKIRNFKDFQEHVPLTDKDNYLRAYPLEKLTWGGRFDGHWEISSTSGSTGVPFYFPRSDEQNEQYAFTAESYLLTNFKIDKRRTLYVNCFALGVWIGGLFTYEAIKIVAKRGGYDLTIINPGLNKPEIIKAVKNLGDKFDQVIIGGYPPFVKDVIDEGIKEGLEWGRYNLGIIFSAEAFHENFRDYIATNAGLSNIYTSTLNHYGIVDLGTTSYETPVCIYIRRESLKNQELYGRVFEQEPSKLPTLAQYLPELFFFEEINHGLVCSAESGLPLIRYDLKDCGGIQTLENVKSTFESHGRSLESELKENELHETLWNLPFVYVYERKDMSVVFSGANIYPETIKKALVSNEIQQFITGKFNLQVQNDAELNQYLMINLELKKDVDVIPAEMTGKIAAIILEVLLFENSEYKVIYQTKGQERAAPVLKFWPYENQDFFSMRGKHKWITKTKI